MSKRNRDIEPLPYERQPNETVKQFEAFKLYRDMGLDRSLREVAKQLNKSLALIGRWSSQNNWIERARLYDIDMDRQETIQNIKKRKEMVKRHAQTSKMFQQKILERLRTLNPHELSPSDLVKWFEIAIKIERLSMGEATEIQDQYLEHTGKDGGAIETSHTERIDLSNLTDEELAQLEKIISKTGDIAEDRSD